MIRVVLKQGLAVPRIKGEHVVGARIEFVGSPFLSIALVS